MKAIFLACFFLVACQPALNHQDKEKEEADTPHKMPEGVFPREKAKTYSIGKIEIERGQSLYAIHCTVCHGATGAGYGLVTTRGFGLVPSMQTEANLSITEHSIMETILQGKGRMFSMNDRLSTEEAAYIASYVKVLQLREHFSVHALSAAEKVLLEESAL